MYIKGEFILKHKFEQKFLLCHFFARKMKSSSTNLGFISCEFLYSGTPPLLSTETSLSCTCSVLFRLFFRYAHLSNPKSKNKKMVACDP